jgi:hypothetical protein
MIAGSLDGPRIAGKVAVGKSTNIWALSTLLRLSKSSQVEMTVIRVVKGFEYEVGLMFVTDWWATPAFHLLYFFSLDLF